MIAFLAKRIIQGVIAIILVLSVVFLALNLSGDPVRLMLPSTASEEAVQEFRAAYGFDRPLGVRYFIFLGRVARLDFGESIGSRRSALTVVLERLLATLQLAFSSLLVASLIGIPLGILAAIYRARGVDFFAVGVSVIGQSVPVFWIALILILLFGVQWPILPPSGYGSFRHLVLPAVTVSLFLLAGITRVTRTSMVETLDKQYLTTARAKGLKEFNVVGKHAIRNAAIPVVTQLSLQFRFVIGGSVVVETIFGWPGLGQLLAQAATARDYPVVTAAVFLVASFIVLANIFVDFVYTLINPRIAL
ncbi:ABC transporter permease [Candidatus Bipolaricaulota bacterium]|nr:ABC transporter permease [Candidatus Bipolaricaulota bacterium]